MYAIHQPPPQNLPFAALLPHLPKLSYLHLAPLGIEWRRHHTVHYNTFVHYLFNQPTYPTQLSFAQLSLERLIFTVESIVGLGL